MESVKSWVNWCIFKMCLCYSWKKVLGKKSNFQFKNYNLDTRGGNMHMGKHMMSLFPRFQSLVLYT